MTRTSTKTPRPATKGEARPAPPAPRGPRRAVVSPQRRERALALADRLGQLRLEFPEFGARLGLFAAQLARDASRTRSGDRDLVLAALGEGRWTAAEVVEHTGLTRWTVDHVLAWLVDHRLVWVTREVRASGGQPRKLYRLRQGGAR